MHQLEARPTNLAAMTFVLLAFAGAALAEITPEVLSRIQRECLHAYPPEIRADMTKGHPQIPDEVEKNPKAQMQYLSKELEVEKGLFYPSLLEELVPPFERYLEPGKTFLDLGSGDGRVVFLASFLGAKATGIEWDEALIKVSEKAQASLGGLVDPDRTHFIQGDFFAHSWADYDVIFYFDQSSHEVERLRKKMKEELRPDARLIVAYETNPFEGYVLEAEIGPMKVFRQPNADQ